MQASDAGAQLRVTGPLWTAALHEEAFISEMAAAAEGLEDMEEARRMLAVMLDEVRGRY